MSSVERPPPLVVCVSSATASNYTYRKDPHSQSQLFEDFSTLRLLRYSCGELATMGTGPRASSGSSCYAAQAQDLSDSSVINNLDIRSAMYTIIHCGCSVGILWCSSSSSGSGGGGGGEE